MMPSRHLSLSGVLDEALLTGGKELLREPMTHDSVNVLLTDHNVGVRKLSAGGVDDEPPLEGLLEGGGSTPNDVRHFPPSPPPPPPTRGPGMMSMSVPITQLDRSPHKLGAEEEQALAEYREALMYQRIVGGFQHKQQQSRRASASGMMTSTMKEHPAAVPVLLRPRMRQHQSSEPHLSLVDMLSPSERSACSWGYLPPSASSSAPRFPVHHHHDDPHSGDEDHAEEEDGDQHHHHDEVFELDL